MSDAKVLTVNATGEVEELNLQPVLDGKMEITGFPTDADGNYFCTMTYDETTRTVTITPTGATFDIFVGGTKYTFTGAQSIVHGAQQGGHFIYFDATGTLVTGQTPWDILSHVPACYVFRDAISGLSIAWEERHHANRDLYWHANQHYNEGTKARSGFAISGYILNDSTANTSITYAIASGIVDDEDIAVTTEALADDGPYTVMRRSGAAGDWVIDRTPVLPFLISGSDVAYNQWTGATWQLTASANNRFVNYYVLAASALPSTSVTPATKNQYILIPGQAVFTSLALAQAELISAIQWGDIPFQEVAPLYKITFQRGNGYATTGRVRIAAVSRIIGTYVQVTQATNPNHGSLGGLLNDDHQQYPILSSGTVAPTSTPDRIGALYVDTAAPALYVGKGIASAADWFPSCAAPEYPEAGMPAPASVPGLEVWNSTFNVKMRSNGTRWVPTSPFTGFQETRSDVVTGPIAESLMHSIDVTSLVKYVGPKGRLILQGAWSNTSSNNAKNIRMRIGRAAGATGFLVFDSTVLGTSAVAPEKVIYARGSESEQGSSAIAVPQSGAFGWLQQMTGLDYAPGGDNVFVSFLAAPVGVGETCTLRWVSIKVEPGF